MAYIIISILLYSTLSINGYPINNGFSIKLSPIPKNIGALFSKIPQHITTNAKSRRDFVLKSFYPKPPEVTGCSNQIAKLLDPNKISDSNKKIPLLDIVSSINLPIIKQPYDKYKILVASAPPEFKISEDQSNNQLVMYVVFSDDTSEETNNINIPNIYFVKKQNGRLDIAEEGTAPILIIDSNRTTTSIKSKEIEKYVIFRNKLTSRYRYDVS